MADKEHQAYSGLRKQAMDNPSGYVVHLVIDFAEKIILPSMLKQAGQNHYITGLKYDLFGISCSNFKINKIFGLPEGLWPNRKDENYVLSKLYHVILETKKNSITYHIKNDHPRERLRVS